MTAATATAPPATIAPSSAAAASGSDSTAAAAASGAAARRLRALANWGRLGRAAATEANRTFHSTSSASAFAAELQDATRLGIHRAVKGSPLFQQLIESRTNLKWVFTTTRLLWITPYSTPRGDEIPHSVAANNQPILCAGMTTWEADVLVIDNWTGHYSATKISFRVWASIAWGGVGVRTKWGPLIGKESGR